MRIAGGGEWGFLGFSGIGEWGAGSVASVRVISGSLSMSISSTSSIYQSFSGKTLSGSYSIKSSSYSLNSTHDSSYMSKGCVSFKI